VSALRSGFERKHWDVLHAEGGFVGGIVPSDLPVAKVLAVHDAEVLRAQEILKCDVNFRDRLRYTTRTYYERRYQRLVYPRFERCVFVAERDMVFNQSIDPVWGGCRLLPTDARRKAEKRARFSWPFRLCAQHSGCDRICRQHFPTHSLQGA
jgi:hypothetical protein